MAVITPTVETSGSNVVLVTWPNMAGSDIGEYYAADHLNDVSMHVFGTFDNATVTAQGTNEKGTPTAPVALHKTDLTTAAIASSAAVLQILETVQQYRPSASGGGSNTALTVIMKFVSTQRRFRQE